MNQFILDRTEHTPEISFNLNTNRYSITGVSVPENASRIYEPLLEWLKDNLQLTKHPQIELVIDIRYFSTTSAKYLLKIVLVFHETCTSLGIPFAVNWFFQEEDESMQEAGELIENISHAKFNYKTYK